MRTRRGIAVGAAILAVAAGVVAGPAPAQALSVTGLTATIALNNCSGSLVRWPSSADTDRAMLLTNGHCYENGFINAGQVLQNRASTRSGTLLGNTGNALGTVRADQLIYATMTNTDVALYRLNETFASIKTKYNVTALTVAPGRPADGSAMTIPSSYWKQVWTCSVNGFVPTLREDQWTWHDSIRYDTGCQTTHGTSGSPIIRSADNQIIGINNTGNDDGASCTLNNPCEVDAGGTVTVHKGQSYGEQTYWFTTCLNATRDIDLTVSGCLLTKPPGQGNTVTVTNPGAQAATVGTPKSLQITATDSAPGQTLTYSATGLPAGLSINPGTGLISGTPTTAQTAAGTVTATDTTGASGSATFTWTVSGGGGGACVGQLLANPGFESGAASWSGTTGAIGQWASQGQAAHGGTSSAWLLGYGSTHTESISQPVTIPAGCNATLTFWVHIDTAETSTTTAYDKLTVTAGSTSLATLSNLNKASGYVQQSYSLSAFAGQTVTLKWNGTEDSSLQTSFVIDDTAVTLS
ncbi:putative Ig domain-containing protein [Dactylosporangium sp. NPDC051484]|uniref:putative Ig domain-containing protein n=1 Tax=Dactylosporangium sp. NPDC051484 TaxID=3154942 RepID=UPI00344E059A